MSKRPKLFFIKVSWVCYGLTIGTYAYKPREGMPYLLIVKNMILAKMAYS